MSTLQQDLDSDFAAAWRPAAGDSLIGIVTGISEREGTYGAYPIVTVKDDNGTELALHAFHSVAANELAKARPVVGERIGIKYLGQRDGQGGTRYHAYKVKVERAGAGFAWSRYGAEEAPSAEVPSDVPSRLPEPEAAPVTSDDIPF